MNEKRMSIATVVRMLEVGGELKSSVVVCQRVELIYRFKTMGAVWAALVIIGFDDDEKWNYRMDDFCITINVDSVELKKYGLTRLLPAKGHNHA